jgi:hypothetical protein
MRSCEDYAIVGWTLTIEKQAHMFTQFIALVALVASLLVLDLTAIRFGLESRHGLDPHQAPRRDMY